MRCETFFSATGWRFWYPPAPIFLHLRASASNDRGPQHAQQVLADLAELNVRRLRASLVITSVEAETSLGITVASPLAATTKRVIEGHYPGTQLVQHPTEPSPNASLTRYLKVVPDIESLLTIEQFEDRLQRSYNDPLDGLLAAVNDRGDGLHASVRFELRKATSRERRRARRVAAIVAGTLSPWPRIAEAYAVRATGKLRQRLLVWPWRFLPPGETPPATKSKLDDHLFSVLIRLSVTADAEHQDLAAKRLDALTAAFAPYVAPGSVGMQPRTKPCRSLLSASELAVLWHLPIASKQADMRTADRPSLPAPVEIKNLSREAGALPLGFAAAGKRMKLAVPSRDRLHVLIIGKTGVGKSTLIANMGRTDIAEGRGVGLIDPHGDLVEDFLSTVPRHRSDDVILIDPTDPKGPSIDSMRCPDPTRRELVAENNLAAFSKVCGFDATNAPRLTHILRNTLLSIVGTEHGSYLAIRPMLTEKPFRDRVVARVEDEEVRSFWRDEFDKWSERYVQEAIPAILNKTGQFISNPHLRRLFGNPTGAIDLRSVMDEGKILLANLSQGKLGDAAAQFTGSMLMAGIQNATMTRADTERSKRRPFYLYADEYATFVNESFADILAQARKYGLRLTAAQQLISQIDEDLMDVMFGNVWTTIAFQVAQKDAERLAAEFAGQVTADELLRLPLHHAVVRTSVNGVPSRPFLIETPSPPKRSKTHADPEAIKRRLARRNWRKATTKKKTAGKKS